MCAETRAALTSQCCRSCEYFPRKVSHGAQHLVFDFGRDSLGHIAKLGGLRERCFRGLEDSIWRAVKFDGIGRLGGCQELGFILAPRKKRVILCVQSM